MNQNPSPRTPEVIQAQYNNLCAQLGQITFQLKELEDAKTSGLTQIRNLNLEFKGAKEFWEKQNAKVEPTITEVPALVCDPVSGEPV